jgi:asparagine synthase (glutamine-hydrolysing)
MWLGAFTPDMQKGLWEDPPQGSLEPRNLYEETRLLYERFPAEEAINKVFYLFARQYLLDFILVKVDRCSMMHSLEVRAPFLDKDVVEFAFPLPWRFKIRHGSRKYLLKQAFKGILPSRILHRKKRGFLIPTALWLKGMLRPLMDELLGESWLKNQGLFRPDLVRRLIKEHEMGFADHRKELWTLLVLQLWLYHHRPSIA